MNYILLLIAHYNYNKTMRAKVKVISVATSSTKNQLEDAINAQLTKGWVYLNMFVNGTNWWIIFQKRLVE